MHGGYYSTNFGTDTDFNVCAAISTYAAGVGVLSNGDFAVIYRANIQNLYGDGITSYNSILLARIDGNSGKTAWAKQVNITLNFGFIVVANDVNVDSQDNIWTILSFINETDYRSALLELSKDGNIVSLLVIANQNTKDGYTMLNLDLQQIIFTNDQEIVALASAPQSLDGFNYNEYSNTDTVLFKINLNKTIEWITTLDLMNARDS